MHEEHYRVAMPNTNGGEANGVITGPHSEPPAPLTPRLTPGGRISPLWNTEQRAAMQTG